MPASIPQAPRVIDRFFEFSMIGLLVTGFIAVLGTHLLDWPSTALAAAALLTRTLMSCGVLRFAVPQRAATVAVLVYFGFLPVDIFYITQSFAPAMVHLVVYLGCLKLLIAKTSRDYGYLKLIAVLELVAAAMFSVTFIFLLYLSVFVLFAIAAMMSGEVRNASTEAEGAVSQSTLRGFPRRLGVLSASLLLGVFALTVGLFLILPRTARAAFGRFAPQRERLTGFSNSVTLGEIGRIKQSGAPVMHVRSYQKEGFLQVKWRGTALAEFDGKRWFNPPDPDRVVRIEGGNIALRTAVIGNRAGRNLIYQVHLEPMVADTLFIAGSAETISIDVPFLRLSRGGAFRVAQRFAARGLNYGVYAFEPDEWAEVRFTAAPLSGALRQELLSLPPTDPRIPALARQFIAGAETEVQKSRAIEKHLRNDYGYTLELLTQPVDDPLSHFLFDRKKGHCEYFASAMAVMLRSIGIPARVVTGFQSGTYNPMTGWQVVRASDAHAWVEAWLEGRGWTTFDPTPPDNSGASGLFSRLSLFADTAEQLWQDWVMSYDLERQLALYAKVQDKRNSLRLPHFDEVTSGVTNALKGGAKPAVILFAIAVLAGFGYLFGPRMVRWWTNRDYAGRIQRGETKPSDATLLYQRMLSVLASRGLQKPPWLTPTEFARVLVPPANAPQIGPLVADATEAYNEVRFGGRTDAAPRMVRVLEAIEKL